MIQGTDVDKINLLKELFDGEVIQQPDETTPSPDDRTALLPDENSFDPDIDLQAFLDEREEFRIKMHQELSIDSYLQHYDELCRYGLDEYLMESLKWHIRNEMEDCAALFFESDFYMRFKHYKTVNEIVITYDPDKFNN